MQKKAAGQKERLYKLLVIGDLGVGKTSIIKRYVHQNFSPHYRATIGVDFALKVLSWDPEMVVRLQLWDIAGKGLLAQPSPCEVTRESAPLRVPEGLLPSTAHRHFSLSGGGGECVGPNPKNSSAGAKVLPGLVEEQSCIAFPFGKPPEWQGVALTSENKEVLKLRSKVLQCHPIDFHCGPGPIALNETCSQTDFLALISVGESQVERVYA